jgi:c-di-GMP-binding flagellar brake protein YcgR
MGKEQRRAKRHSVQYTGMIYSTNGKPIVRCQLRDISATGAQLALEREIDLPPKFVLALSRDGQVRRQCTIAWQLSIVVGVKFASQPA